jgi:CoA-binding domain
VYGQIWRHASIAEARRVVLAGATAAAVILAINPLLPDPLPRSVIVVAAFVATMFIGLARFQARLFSWRRRTDRTTTPVAVLGAGGPGPSIIREMQSTPAIGRIAVVVVDDDPAPVAGPSSASPSDRRQDAADPVPDLGGSRPSIRHDSRPDRVAASDRVDRGTDVGCWRPTAGRRHVGDRLTDQSAGGRWDE